MNALNVRDGYPMSTDPPVINGTLSTRRHLRDPVSIARAVCLLINSDRLWESDPSRVEWCNTGWGDAHDVAVVCARNGVGCNIDHVALEAVSRVAEEPT